MKARKTIKKSTLFNVTHTVIMWLREVSTRTCKFFHGEAKL